MKTSEIDIHALAAMNGAGNAAKEIRKTIDPFFGIGDGKEKKFEVTVEFRGTAQYDIVARCEAEAKEKTLEKAWSGNVDFFDEEIYNIAEVFDDE